MLCFGVALASSARAAPLPADRGHMLAVLADGYSAHSAGAAGFLGREPVRALQRVGFLPSSAGHGPVLLWGHTSKSPGRRCLGCWVLRGHWPWVAIKATSLLAVFASDEGRGLKNPFPDGTLGLAV